MTQESDLQIIELAENLYTVDAPLGKSPIGRRMTVIRLKNNQLIVHSPVFLEGKSKDALDKLGEVSAILVPNEWHTLDTAAVHDQYPNARVLVPEGIKEQLSARFSVSGSYESNWESPLSDEVDCHVIAGLKKPEVAIYHRSSKTLVVADLFFNFKKEDFSGITQWLMNLNQATRFGTTRFYKWMMVADKAAFKADLEQLAKNWDIERIIMGHGHILEKNGSAVIKESTTGLA